MDSTHWKHVCDLVAQALDQEEGDRRAFVAEHTRGDPELQRLASRALAHLQDVPRPSPAADSGASPAICLRVRLGDQTISTFSSQLRFDTAREVTTSELRLELIFPADERSGQILRWLAAIQ